MVDFALNLQSGLTKSTFSYPDYEAYRDHLRSFSGIIAVSIDQLRLTGIEGMVSQRNAETGSLIGRLGLLRPGASNAEIALGKRAAASLTPNSLKQIAAPQ